jgi:hypothetical protein
VSLVEEKRRVADVLSELNVKWASANALSLGMNVSPDNIRECRIGRNLPEEMKMDGVLNAIQLAWNDTCKGASKYVNSNQVIKVYLSFLFNLTINIFDKISFEEIGQLEKCQLKLEEMVWKWFQWRCMKIKDEDFLREFEEIEKLGFKIPRMLSYRDLEILKEDMLIRDQFVSEKLVQGEAFPRDRYMLGGKEELDVNDLVKIHTKYYRKSKSKIDLQAIKRKKRKKYRLKGRNKENQENASGNKQGSTIDMVNEKKPPDKKREVCELKPKNASVVEQRNGYGSIRNKKPPDIKAQMYEVGEMKVSNSKKRKLLSVLYEKTVMLKKGNVDSLNVANEEYDSNLPIKDEFCMLFKAKMVLGRLLDIGIDIVNHQNFKFNLVEMEFEVFKDVPICNLESFIILPEQDLEVSKANKSSLIQSEVKEIGYCDWIGNWEKKGVGDRRLILYDHLPQVVTCDAVGCGPR